MESLQPLVAETSGKLTWSMPESPSAAVAWSVNDPEPPGRNHNAFVAALKYWAPAPVTAVGATTATVGVLVVTLASALAAEAADWLPTRSEIR